MKKSLKTTANILNFVVFGGFTAIFMLGATYQEGFLVGGALISVGSILMGIAVYSLINYTNEERAAMRAKSAEKKDANGVHWFWWVFWLIAFFPALIVVAIMHTGRKNRAAIRSSGANKETNDV